ncbi:hypothetical protein [Paenibacillus amylolyticus]|uniref:hypothetical protein n=1 Tax=Paenibacillus amylolyticus TaxID=1451 RepID=UPI000B867FD6|nr:hypothetical protein [Paenibacillus amylolyticus]
MPDSDEVKIRYKKFINGEENKGTQSLTKPEREKGIFNSLFGITKKVINDYRLVRVSDGKIFGFTIEDNECLTVYMESKPLNLRQADRWRKTKEILIFFKCDYLNYYEIPDWERCEKAFEIAQKSIPYEHKYGKSIVQYGELGECFAGYCLNLYISKNLVQAGYDALDIDMNRVQIKTKRLHSKGKTLSKLKEEGYDYCLLVLLNDNYTLNDIFRLEKSELDAILANKKTKRIELSDFTKEPPSESENKRTERKAIAKTTYLGGEKQKWMLK